MITAASTFNLPLISDINDPSAPTCGAALIHRTQTLDGKRIDTAGAFLPVDIALERKSSVVDKTVATDIQVSKLSEALQSSSSDGKT